jgi:hypothetical protein
MMIVYPMAVRSIDGFVYPLYGHWWRPLANEGERMKERQAEALHGIGDSNELSQARRQGEGRCAHCGRPGQPYTYKGIEFDGLCAFKGERLCPACRDARTDAEGVSILVVDDRPSIPPYVVNTVRDKDVVHVQVRPEHRGIDGRDAGRRRPRRPASEDRR